MCVNVCLVIYTDLSDKEPRRQVGVGRVVISGSLGGLMVNTLARNARAVGLIPHIFIASITQVL